MIFFSFSLQDSQVNCIDVDPSTKGNFTTRQLLKGSNGSNNRRSQQSPPKCDVSHAGKGQGQWSADQDVTHSSANKLGDRKRNSTANSKMKIKEIEKTQKKVSLKIRKI